MNAMHVPKLVFITLSYMMSYKRYPNNIYMVTLTLSSGITQKLGVTLSLVRSGTKPGISPYLGRQ